MCRRYAFLSPLCQMLLDSRSSHLFLRHTGTITTFGDLRSNLPQGLFCEKKTNPNPAAFYLSLSQWSVMDVYQGGETVCPERRCQQETVERGNKCQLWQEEALPRKMFSPDGKTDKIKWGCDLMDRQEVGGGGSVRREEGEAEEEIMHVKKKHNLNGGCSPRQR